MSTKKNRTELKKYFVAEAIPKEGEFVDFIDATINQADDGIKKDSGNPIAIQAEGEVGGTQEVLQLYTNFNDEVPNWSLNLNPRVNATAQSISKKGLNIKDNTGESRLFIESGNGNIGLGTIEPTAKLTIEGNKQASLLSVVDTTNKRSEIFKVSQQNGNGAITVCDGEANKEVKIESNSISFEDNTDAATPKNITITATEKKLSITADEVNISGNVAMNNLSTDTTLTNGGVAEDTIIPSQRAVKDYVDTRLPKGLISMWSGAEIPKGWALCDGENETPNLSGRFIVGLDKTNTDYNQTKKTGGNNQVILNTSQIPAHSHTGSTSSNGAHIHNISKDASGNDSGDGLSTVTMDGEKHGTLKMVTDKAGNHTHSLNINNTGGNQPHENRPPYFVLAYIIKL